MKHLLLGAAALALMTVGCIHEPTMDSVGAPAPGTPPPPAPPAAAVSSCETTRTWHNIWVLSGTVFGGLGGSGATVDALSSDHNVQTGLSIGVAAAAVLGGLATAAAGITSDTYATDNCQQILQQLVAASAAAKHP